MTHLAKLSAALGFVSLFFVYQPASTMQGRPSIELDCKHLAPIEHHYLARHVNFTKPSANLEKRTMDQFIKKLDPSKVYLLKSDIHKIEKHMRGIFAKTKKRDCSAVPAVNKIYEARISERVKFVRKHLGKNFKFDRNTELTLDPEKRDYPKTLAEAQSYHKKYLQFQVANYIATDMKLDEAKEHVVRNYERLERRTKEKSGTDLWAMYLDAFARSLDPHSSYLSADALEDFEIQMRLSLEGIGATLSSRDGFTVIEQLIPGGAAAGSGKLKPKDKIIAVGQGPEGKMENVIELELRDVVKQIRGPKGSNVRLAILRKEGKETKRFVVTLVRDKIKLEDEAAAIHYIDRKINGESKTIGLVDLPSFYADHRKGGRSAAKDLKKLLNEAKKKKVDGLVLDLSTNGGGSLEDAVKIAGLFFKTGNVVKQSHRDPGKGEIELADEDPAVDYAGPLVVLTSRISASASEIVAGTLQDYKRAIVVGGDHTFGKGTVQSVEPLPPGLGAIKTTVGMFFTAGGDSTQHKGVDADIVLPSVYSTEEIGEKTLDYSLPPKSIKPFLSKSAYVGNGEGVWRPVDKKLIQELEKKSKQRVAKSEKFKEIKDDIAKAKKRGRVVKVDDVLSDKKDDKENGSSEEDDSGILSAAEKKKKYLERADIQEAINVAADFVTEYEAISITIGQKSRSSDSKN